MALFDFKGFFTKNKEEYQSEAKNSFSLNERRVEFNQQESEDALNQRRLKSFLANMDESSLFNLLNGEAGGAFGGGIFNGGGSVQEQVWQYFTSLGYSKASTAGIMGNIEAESSFKPDITNSNGGAFGLVQWLGGRKTNMINYAKNNGMKETDVKAQLEFIHHEIETRAGWISPNGWYPTTHTVDGFRSTNDPVYAAEAFAESFERMSKKEYRDSYNKRTNAAKKYYNEFKNWTPSVSVQASGSFVNPSAGIVTSPFGPRFHPVHKERRMHSGIDVARGDHRNILAANSGRVEFVKNSGSTGYGKYLKINHGVIGGKKIDTLYAHLQSISVSSGQNVTSGQVLGIRGTTGTSTGEHLHFEIHEDGKAVDPLKYVSY